MRRAVARVVLLVGLLLPARLLAVADLPGFELRAQLVARQHVVLSAGITSQVIELSAREGELVGKNQLLAELDCDRLRASESIVDARILAAQARHRSLLGLQKLNSVGAMEVSLAGAEVAMAKGELASVKAQLKHCQIFAPYTARVVKRLAQPHQYVEQGAPLLEVYAPDALEVQFVAPSAWLAKLAIGSRFTLHVGETQQALQGRVERLGAKVDAVSQTIQVFGALEQAPSALLHGMSGKVVLHDRATTAQGTAPDVTLESASG